jgi:hypothetical protein
MIKMMRAGDNGGGQGLWAITSYYNPAGYRSRLRNYRIFRQSLAVPLVTVEWSRDGIYELQSGDADILIQISGGDVLWQKERLLNMALAAVPSQVDKIAWLDCDIVFGNSTWAEHARDLLDRCELVQLFEGVVDVPRDAPIDDLTSLQAPISGLSDAARVMDRNGAVVNWGPSKTQGHRPWVPGMAWAARREIIQRHGFYDVCILGSGDRYTTCAAFGQIDDALKSLWFNEHRAHHYSKWAEGFHRDVNAAIRHVPGTIYHLWHGDLADRLYPHRNVGFWQYEFDPDCDIAMTEQGCWRWNTDKPEMHEKRYFELRKEDGRVTSQAVQGKARPSG